MIVDVELGRALRLLAPTGRRLVRRAAGWAVIGGHDARARAVIELAEDAALRLLAMDAVRAAEGGGYVLASGDEAARPGPGVFIAAGQPRSQRAGVGFVALARRAAEGEGPLTLRQSSAGLRLTADVEAAGRDPCLSMAWDGTPGARGRRQGGRSSRPVSAGDAMRRLARVKARAGAPAFALAHAACVEGRTLVDLEARFGLARRSGAEALARALEAVAAGYEA
jgi:hypothetical protein